MELAEQAQVVRREELATRSQAATSCSSSSSTTHVSRTNVQRDACGGSGRNLVRFEVLQRVFAVVNKAIERTLSMHKDEKRGSTVSILMQSNI